MFHILTKTVSIRFVHPLKQQQLALNIRTCLSTATGSQLSISPPKNGHIESHSLVVNSLLPNKFNMFVRSFANVSNNKKKKNNKNIPKYKYKSKKKKKNAIFTASKTSSRSAETGVPPAVLLPTGSKNAYIAGIAIKNDSSSNVNPKEFFGEYKKFISKNYIGSRHGVFEYFPQHFLRHKKSSSSLPAAQTSTPEIAFIGRSNVGKSSLMNALMKKNLAKCSKTPGRTQQAFYYGLLPGSAGTTIVSSSSKKAKARSAINNTQNTVMDPNRVLGYMIDLPGYGYGSAPVDVVKEWNAMIQKIIIDRRDSMTLQRLFVLVDSRRGISSFEQSIMTWFDEAEINYTIVITKSDCVSNLQIIKVANEACWRYHRQTLERMAEESALSDDDDHDASDFMQGYCGPIVHVTSTKSGDGIQELMTSIETEFM